MNALLNKDPGKLGREELIEQNQLLNRLLEDLKQDNLSMLSLLVDVSRRMQVSSASIKAAVTSLLDHDIFWDASAQHEFLQTINSSIDSLSSLNMLISLATRLRVDKLVLKQEPQLLQEILSVLEREFNCRHQKLTIDMVFPLDGKTVYVDYEYLMIALRLLFEAIGVSASQIHNVRVVAKEFPGEWVVEIQNFPVSIYKLVCDLSGSLSEEFLRSEHISAEAALMIYTAYYIFQLQDINLTACESEDDKTSLQLVIPSNV